MIRPQFSEIVSNLGMISAKEAKILRGDRDETRITEFDLLTLPNVNEVELALKISDSYSIPYVDLKNASVEQEVIDSLKKKDLRRLRVIPIQVQKSKVIVAIYDPSARSSEAQLSQSFDGRRVEFVLTEISSWRRFYLQAQESVEDLMSSIKEVKSNSADVTDIKAEDIGADVVSFVNQILADAFIQKVSDIHVEPYEKVFRVRFRLDGSLKQVATPPRAMMLPVISRLKILAELDISEKRKPQDGRIKLSIGGSPIDYRVSSLPTLFGEKIVLRLLDQSNLQLDMTKLGFEQKQLEIFKTGIHNPYGMVLVTGPTGSGKTTTLYSALAELNTEDTNISTAEDPCEFNLQGINQVNVKKEVGLTFASALKSFLRQDPDIIMVGEIRDYEVGEIAVEAALTGHMVLSTLHTNDAPAAITRLLNMGVEAFLVVAALKVIVAQRLLRKICTECREVDDSISEKQLIAVGYAAKTAKKVTVYRGKGCSHCNNSGFKGRVAIYEVLEVTSELRELILNNASAEHLKKQAIKDGMKTLRMSALTKVAQGLATIEEAIGNSASDT